MPWDILIVIGAGLSQLVVTWYGVHVSVKENRVRNAVVIALIGIAGIALTVWATIRSMSAQEHLQTQLDQIQHNTERSSAPSGR
jgi:hypothetical protein